MSDAAWKPWDHSRFKPLQVVPGNNFEAAVKKLSRKQREEADKRPPYAQTRSQRRRTKDKRAGLRRSRDTGR